MAIDRQPLSHKQRAARRKAIAAAVKESLDMGQDVESTLSRVAGEHNVTVPFVRTVCKYRRVKIPRLPTAKQKGSTYDIIALLMREPAQQSEMTLAEIAKKYGLSRERVRQIKQRALEAGVLRRSDNVGINASR
jgi:hypothetical protein